jgi:two-component system LytT family response regulator
MKKLRAIIVDDEHLASQYLESKLKKFAQLDVITTCKNAKEAFEVFENFSPDLIFLDIEMPGLSGLDIAKKIGSKFSPVIIFTTAFEQYALDAFTANATDYILKPINEERLKIAINKAYFKHFKVDYNCSVQQLCINNSNEVQSKEISLGGTEEIRLIQGEKYTNKVIIKDRDTIHLISQSDIEWIDAAGDYVCVHANGDTHVKRSTLKEIEHILNPSIFKRIHRSTIVNLNYIDKAIPLNKGEYFLQIGEHQQLKVSRNYKESIRNYLQQ